MNQPKGKKLELKKSTLLRLTQAQVAEMKMGCKYSCIRTNL
jgi:hypothetical protein